MNDYTKAYYKKFRNSGYPASYALHAARTLDTFEDLQNQELVRLQVEPEMDNYFDVYGEPDTDRERKKIEHCLDLYGCWVVLSEYKCPTCGSFEVADSIGMCVYNDPTDPYENCYVIDLMANAIEKIDTSQIN